MSSSPQQPLNLTPPSSLSLSLSHTLSTLRLLCATFSLPQYGCKTFLLARLTIYSIISNYENQTRTQAQTQNQNPNSNQEINIQARNILTKLETVGAITECEVLWNTTIQQLCIKADGIGMMIGGGLKYELVKGIMEIRLREWLVCESRIQCFVANLRFVW